MWEPLQVQRSATGLMEFTGDWLFSTLFICLILLHCFGIFLGHAVAQLVEVLRYKPEGCGFDSRWCHWNFSLT